MPATCVTEAVDEGADTVQASVSYTLGTDVENLTLTGTGGLTGTGNAADNIIIGNSGSNVLVGLGGRTPWMAARVRIRRPMRLRFRGSLSIWAPVSEAAAMPRATPSPISKISSALILTIC